MFENNEETMLKNNIFLNFSLSCLIILGLSEIEVVNTKCYNENLTVPYGIVSQSNRLYTTETCRWTFHPPESRTDVVFAFKLIHLKQTGQNIYYSSYKIHLPDGVGNFAETSISQSKTPWCGLHVKKRSKLEMTCQSDFVMNGVCAKKTRTSLTWPPQITSNLISYWLIFQYEFIDCPARHIVHETTTAPITETHRTTTIAKSATTTDTNTISINLHQCPGNSELVGTATLAVLLFITVVFVVVLLFKLRKSTNGFSKNAPVQKTTEQQETYNVPDNVLYTAVNRNDVTIMRYSADVEANRDDSANNPSLYSVIDRDGGSIREVVINSIYTMDEAHAANIYI